MSILRLSVFLMGAVLAGTEYSVAQDIDSRNLTIQQQSVAEIAQPASADLSVTAWVDHKDNTYKIGESVSLFVKVGADAYLTIVSVGPSGNAVQLYPNEFQPSKMIKAGETVEVPGEDAGAQIVASSPAGNELIRVIATQSPIDVIDPALLAGPGAFKDINGGAKRLAKDLALAVEQRNDIAFYDKVIKTVEAETEVSIELPAPVQSKLAPMIATDKSDYIVGDTVALAVTALDSCHLWVVNVSSDKTVHVLFPNKLVTDNALEASDTVLVSGGTSPVAVRVAGPAGLEAVYALCSADETPPWANGVNFSELFPALDTNVGLGKALVAVDPAAASPTEIPDVYAWSVKILGVADKL